MLVDRGPEGPTYDPPQATSQPLQPRAWLVSYADFITLLFAFFVVLYARRKSTREEWEGWRWPFSRLQRWSSLRLPRHKCRSSNDPMPFSTAQAIENTERTASLGGLFRTQMVRWEVAWKMATCQAAD